MEPPRVEGSTDSVLFWTRAALLLGATVALLVLSERSPLFLGLVAATIPTTIWTWRRRRRARRPD